MTEKRLVGNCPVCSGPVYSASRHHAPIFDRRECKLAYERMIEDRQKTIRRFVEDCVEEDDPSP